MTRRWKAILAMATLAVAVSGCSSGTRARRANIDLRKQVASLQEQNAELQREIGALRAPRETPATMPTTLPAEVVVTTGLKFGRLTGFQDGALKVYVVPTDKTGDEIKAAGTFRVELYDLSRPEPKLAEWSFTSAEALDNWVDLLTIYGYVLDCPMDTPPPGSLTVRVDFVEALTGRRFNAQHEFAVEPH